MVCHRLRPALTAAALTASTMMTGGLARADTLSWSLAYSQMSSCVWGTGCVGATLLGKDVEYDSSFNATSSMSIPSYGSAFSSAAPGSGGLFPLPELKALVTSNYVTGSGGAADTYSYVYTSTQGVQGFTWTGPAGIDIPIDAFIAQADYTSIGSPASGTGGFSAAFALTDSAVEAYDVGLQWYEYNVGPQMAGQFAADCDTTGALGLANPFMVGVSAPGSGSIGLTPSSCLGAQTTFHLDPGDTFYLWARMTAFYAGTGTIDATNSLNVSFNPLLSPEVRALMEANLAPVEGLRVATAVPEPNIWAMMVIGFGLLGSALRRRRIARA